MKFVAGFGTPSEIEEKTLGSLALAQRWLLDQVRKYVKKTAKYDFDGCCRLDAKTAAKFAARSIPDHVDDMVTYLDAAEVNEFTPFLFEARVLHDSVTVRCTIRVEK